MKPVQETADVTTMLAPGEQLRLKRLEFGLQVEDIANELFLSVSQVEAIEVGDHENLPGSTYIMGYWRSYAGLLDLDLTQAIEKYRDSLEKPEAGIVLAPNHRRAHGHQEKSRKKSALRFFILSALFLGLIWYWQNPADNPFQQWMQNQATSKLNLINTASRQEEESDARESEDFSDQIVQLEPEVAEVAAPEPIFSDEFVGQGTENENAAGTLILINPVGSVAPDQIVEIEVTNEVIEAGAIDNTDELPRVETDQSGVDDSSIQGDQEALEEMNAGTAQEAVDTSSTHWLVLRVTSPTWLDVRDRSGEKLVYRTTEQGEVFELNGIPPFAVFIAVSTAVIVEYLGEKVEFEADSDNSFARFLVGDYE
jgi:cytoskeleton protein RodZ